MHGTSQSLQPGGEASQPGGVFQSTLWSQVRAAGRANAPEGRDALEGLCRVYWGPIYGFLRRWGHGREDAQDLTQGFFAYVLEEGLVGKADRERGRFRSFLLGALKFFVSNEAARAKSLKRGGRVKFVEIDGVAELPVLADMTPERVFERKWALAVISQGMQRLEKEYRRAGLEDEFRALQPYLSGEPEDHLSDLALRLGKSHGAVRVMMFRIRNRFRRVLREVIADTLSDPAQVNQELTELQRALRDQ